MAGMKMDWRRDHWVVQVFDGKQLIEFSLDDFIKLEPVKYAAPLIVADAAGVDLGEQLLHGMPITSTSH